MANKIAFNEIRYSVNIDDEKVWLVLLPSMLLSFIASGFETEMLTCFQHRVITKEDETTEWGEVEIIVMSEELIVKN